MNLKQFIYEVYKEYCLQLSLPILRVWVKVNSNLKAHLKIAYHHKQNIIFVLWTLTWRLIVFYFRFGFSLGFVFVFGFI